jgi:RNA polymerase sigma-70 factor (ECF subfamily)
MFLREADWLNPPELSDASPAPDRDLIRAARAGDRAAYGELYRRYSPMVHGLILARAGPDHAEDLVQDVFLSAMTHLGRLREEDHFGGWIAAIARNRITDQFRRTREFQSAKDSAAEISINETSSAQTEASAALATIRSLPEAYRETLMLRLVEGMTGPEIASRTGLTHESVRVNLHRGMKLLRERLSAPGALGAGGKEMETNE